MIELEGLKNVVFDGTLPTGKTRGDLNIHTALRGVVLSMAKRHPDWVFLTIGFGCARFVVTKGKEILGEIDTVWHGGGTATRLRNVRIEVETMRGLGKLTKDPVKARKLMEKYFQPKTTEELRRERVVAMRSAVHKVAQAAQSRVVAERVRMEGSFLDYSVANWEDFKCWCDANGRVHAHDGEYPLLQLVAEGASAMQRGLKERKAVGVLIEGETYRVLVEPMTGRDWTLTFETNTLPLNLKRSIGLLKLVAVGTHVPDVGVRVEADAYVVQWDAPAKPEEGQADG